MQFWFNSHQLYFVACFFFCRDISFMCFYTHFRRSSRFRQGSWPMGSRCPIRVRSDSHGSTLAGAGRRFGGPYPRSKGRRIRITRVPDLPRMACNTGHVASKKRMHNITNINNKLPVV